MYSEVKEGEEHKDMRERKRERERERKKKNNTNNGIDRNIVASGLFKIKYLGGVGDECGG